MNENIGQQEEAKSVRPLAAGVVAAGATVLAAALFCHSREDLFVAAYDKAMLATLIAVAVVAGARALEGPQPQTAARKRSNPPTAIEMARSWLLCFIALAAALLLTDFVARYEPAIDSRARSEDVLRVSGKLTVETPDRTRSAVVAGQNGK